MEGRSSPDHGFRGAAKAEAERMTKRRTKPVVAGAYEAALLASQVAATFEGQDQAAAQKAVSQAFTQDSLGRSLRVGSAALAIISTVLMDPTVQGELIKLIGAWLPAQYMPMATAIAGAALAIISKTKDQRPVRGKV
jgi:putative copper export protein